MTTTKVPVELSSTPGIVDNSNATAITIDSSENVLVGRTSRLTSQSESISSDTVVSVHGVLTANQTNCGVMQYTGNAFQLRAYGATSGTGNIQFKVGGGGDSADSEAMRIDSSGNLLVGNTVANPASGFSNQLGFGFTKSTGKVEIATTANDAVMELGKNEGTDGNLLVLRKQSTTVGVIQTKSSQLSIGTGDTGIQTNQDVNAIIPHNTATNANVDNSIDLGYAAGGTNLRFKDLYLSGGAYLGGVAAANKLDSYEQGSWTSTTTGITGVNVGAAVYTKIGQLVCCDMRVTWTGSSNDSVALTFSLPFASNNPGAASRTGIVFYQGSSILGGNAISAHVSVGASVVAFYGTGGGTFRSILASDVNGTYDWLVSFFYFTDS